MAVPSASGGYRAALEGARTLLANSAAFRAAVGAVDVAAALALINRGAVALNDAGLALPIVRARITGEFTSERVGVNCWSVTGTATFNILIEPPSQYTGVDEQEAWAANLLGSIVGDLETLAATGPYLYVQRINAAEPSRSERGDPAYWLLSITADFGAES